MFESARHIYSVKVCPSDPPEELEMLLNRMSEEGWELYTLHESESKRGGLQYNCIFYREYEENDPEDEIVDVDNFKTRMEKMMHPSDEPYAECKELQGRINRKQEEINNIKNLLDTPSDSIDHKMLNEEISRKLKELNELKNELADAIDPIHMYDRINQDILTIVISDELIDLVDTAKNGELISETVNLRQKLADKFGYVIPVIRFTNSEALEANEYRIDIRGLKAASGMVYPGYRRFFTGQSNMSRKPKDAIADIDTISGQDVFWIEESKTKSFWEKGLTPAQVIVNNLEYLVCRHVDEILSYNDINNYIEIVGNQNLFLIENLIPDLLTIGDLRHVFTGLIREKVSVKDIVYIFERLNDFVQETVERDILLEKLRISLARQISHNIADINGNIYGIEIGEDVSEIIEKLLIDDDADIPYFDLKNPKIGRLIKNVLTAAKNPECEIGNIAVIAPPYMRQQIYHLFEQVLPGLNVICRAEVASGFNLEIIKTLDKV